MTCAEKEESKRLLPVERVLATQFHPRKVAAIDTAPKGRMKRDRSAAAVPKARIGTCACRVIYGLTWKNVINSRHFRNSLSPFNCQDFCLSTAAILNHNVKNEKSCESFSLALHIRIRPSNLISSHVAT